MKRPNGYGTITKLSGARRKPYAVRVSQRDKKGRIVQRYLSFHATQKEAFEALESYTKKRATGEAPAPESLGVTLQEVYRLWSARKYEGAGKSLVGKYRASWRRVSRYALKPIRTIGVDQWQAIIDDARSAGLSQSAVSSDIMLVRALCSYAMERDWMLKDYSQFVRLPSIPPKYEKGAFSLSEIETIETLARQGIPGADATLVLCYTGWRVSEFLQLTLDSYDPREKTLRGGLKTKAGKNRIVPIHPRIQPYVDDWAAQNGQYLYLFKGAHNAENFRRTLFSPLMERLNRPTATPHWCRHTFASLLHQANANELNIKRLMGHSDKDVTERYTHTSLEELRNTILLLR